MRTIRDKHIEGELVQIDGTHFIGCTLTDCILQYGGGHVVMEGTRISRCHHVFIGPARLTVNYLEAMELVPPNDLVPRPDDEIIH
jgi:hypothetical protein